MGSVRLINIGRLYGLTGNNAVKVGNDLAEVATLDNAYLDFSDGALLASA